jgi:hypothetical protein
MTKLIALMVFLLHIFSCIWFYIAKFSYFHRDTWVYRYGYVDEDPWEQYVISFYWACQTVTTVGFGDICSKTRAEFVVCLIWMAFGTLIYTYTVGNMFTIISDEDEKTTELNNKLATLAIYAENVNLPVGITMRIQRFLESDSREISRLGDQDELVSNLPPSLRTEVIAY